MSAKPVIIEFADGTTYGVESEAVANRVYPTAKIVGHQDGSPFEAAKPKPARKRPSRAKKASTPATKPEAATGTPEGKGNGTDD